MPENDKESAVEGTSETPQKTEDTSVPGKGMWGSSKIVQEWLPCLAEKVRPFLERRFGPIFPSRKTVGVLIGIAAVIIKICCFFITSPVTDLLHPRILFEKYLPHKSDHDRVITNLSWNPRAFLREDFLTDKECDHLINLGKTAGTDRTPIPKASDDVVSRVEDRIAKWTFLPNENGEPMKVVRYRKGHKEEAQRDYSLITVLMYLNNVESGGDTVLLRNATKKQGHGIEHDSPGECAKKGVQVIPRRGTALLVFNLNASVVQDAISTRRDCPVLMGEKWTAVMLVHVDSFNSDNDCKDKDDQCIEWAKEGECMANKGYMLNACKKSCKEC